MFKVKTFKSKNSIKTVSKLLIKNKIYSPLGILNEVYNQDEYTIYSMTVSYNTSTQNPIGCCVVFKHNQCLNKELSVFVKQRFRRIGIGTLMLNIATKKSKKVICHKDGTTKNSSKFWDNQKHKYRFE